MGQAGYSLSRESYMIGRPREGIAQGRQAVALLEQSDERWWLGQALGVLGLHLLHIGDFGPALEILDRMRALGEAIGEARLQANAAWTIGRVHTIMGDADLAIAACRRAVELAVDPVAQAGAAGWLGAAYLEGGHAGQAIDLLEDGIGRLQQLSGAGGYRYGQIDGMFRALLSEAYLAKGDAGRAGDLGAEALAIARAGGWGVAIGYAERAVGRVALAAGQLDEAEAAVNRSLSTFTEGEALAQAARSRLPLAEIRAARGDRDAAAAELGAALQTFSQMRAPTLVERTRRLAQDLGVTLEAGPRETPSGNPPS
jgi:tetratricopeptide (TPR) repeat protein